VHTKSCLISFILVRIGLSNTPSYFIWIPNWSSSDLQKQGWS